jgi:hypothetical protein
MADQDSVSKSDVFAYRNPHHGADCVADSPAHKSHRRAVLRSDRISVCSPDRETDHDAHICAVLFSDCYAVTIPDQESYRQSFD